MIENVLLLGNGFNYTILNFIKDDILRKEVSDIINLWNKFNDFFGEIRKIEKFENWSDESIIDIVDGSIKILRRLPHLENEDLKECLENIENTFFEEINNKLLDFVEKFIKAEIEDIYKRILSFYNNHIDCNLYDFIVKNKMSVYTTNYDGIAEVILAYDKNGVNNGNKIKLRDMFGKLKNDGCNVYNDEFEDFCNVFDPDNYFRDENESKLIHLHGSYKYFLYSNTSDCFVKIKSDGWNFYEKNKNKLTPIIVFGAKNYKEKQINNFQILVSYFESFKNEIRNAKNIIIWGQSLENDPHIEKAIKKFFIDMNYNKNESKNIILVDVNSEHKVKELLEGNKLYFYHINPNNFSNLKELFEELINKST